MSTYEVKVRKKSGVWQFKTQFSGWNNSWHQTQRSAVNAGMDNIRNSVCRDLKFEIRHVTTLEDQ